MRETVWMIMQKVFSFYGVHSTTYLATAEHFAGREWVQHINNSIKIKNVVRSKQPS